MPYKGLGVAVSHGRWERPWSQDIRSEIIDGKSLGQNGSTLACFVLLPTLALVYLNNSSGANDYSGHFECIPERGSNHVAMYRIWIYEALHVLRS
jgi:hypothetical protein